MNDESCIFCRMARKQAPVSCVYEDEKVMAFLDVRPLNEGHTLVIPKEHYETIFPIFTELSNESPSPSKRLQKLMESAYSSKTGRLLVKRCFTCTFMLFPDMKDRN